MRLPEATNDADGPNLTPVIDIVFLLLIFFLVATRYDREQQEREVDINLPEITEAQPLSMARDLVINITSDGRFKAVGKEWNERELADLIKQAREANPQRSALIAGDSESALKFTVRVKGLCNQAGMKCRVAALQEM